MSLTENKTNSTIILGITMFIMGGCGLAYEYTFSKTASDLLGNSVHQWAIIIAVMLCCMGLGADIQKHLSDKHLLDKLLFSQMALSLLGGFGPIIMLYSFGSYSEHYILIQYFLVSVVGVLIGFEIPLLLRLNALFSEDIRLNLAGILKMDYIGALCGALVWTFVLPKFFSIIQMAFFLSMATTVSSVVCFLYFRRFLGTPVKLIVVQSVTVLILGFGFYKAGDWTSYSEQSLFRDRIVFSHTSKYQHIVLTESQSGELSCYINGKLQFFEGDEFIYHEFLVHPAMAVTDLRERVLVLGGGDGLAVRELLKYPDVKEIVLVDLDPEMTNLAMNHPAFRKLNENSLNHEQVNVISNDALIESGSEIITIPKQPAFPHLESHPVAKVKVLNMDAVNYVQQATGMFDVIIADFPDPGSTELAKLYAQHFYGLVAKKLKPKGIFVQQSSSPVYAKESFLCIGRTMQSAGIKSVPYRANIPSFGEWGWWVGGKDYTEAFLKGKMKEIEDLEVSTRFLTPELTKGCLDFGKKALETSETKISTISNDAVFHYYLKGWRESVY